MNDGPVRLGILGFGNQGSNYARYITEGLVPDMVIGAIADTDPTRLVAARELHPNIPLFENGISMMDSGQVDAVITCIPHYEHPQAGIDALSRGLHALVEKPAGVYTKQVAELNAYAAARPQLTFGIMFNQRNNPLYVRIKEIIDAGEIGAIRRSNWIITTWWRPQGYYDQSAWRGTWGGEGGGVLVNQAPHQLDLWQWICGTPRSVFSKVGYGFRRNIAVEDEVTVLADYGNDVTGVFITATHDLVGTDRFEILGDQGKIVVENSAVATVTRLTKPERQLSDEVAAEDISRALSGKLDPADLYTTETIQFDSRWGSQHANVLQNFAANILRGEPLLAPGADGITGVRLANAIHLSSWTGRDVPLDFDEDEYIGELNARIRAEGSFVERA
ncbi:Gfo/Idh/MocA family oxidoreductase [Cryobacterium lactosi]|uniref:Gfo/Idh/MocA family oxidoreductase n=1 Tax=Cryobacterium lactosi TaxID=1259202 RepID=A0A4R9BYA2_9MICO|nr:Gfo/Idh/MocA family oxidoreductase [Cryobacterium lactosi]TFD93059.1 Gfo/Idh/MocA family oxidoreductase [Cryobacterium lactosi]